VTGHGRRDGMRPPLRASRAAVVALLALGAFDLGLEQSIVLPALPATGRQEDATPDSMTWLVTGYLLASAPV
jgi:MFS family permease